RHPGAPARRKIGNASGNGPGRATVSGRPVADSLSAAAGSEKYGMPSGVRAVVKDNRVAEISSMPSSEGAGVEPGEGETAVTGVGCARIIGAGGSRIVVGNNDLVRIIRVSPREGLRLSNVGRGLCSEIWRAT